MQRRTFLAGSAVLAGATLVATPLSFAQGKPETSKVAIAVGGKNLFYYLPLTIAERRNYFRDEGLDVEISDFAGGSQALKAAVGGSADVVSGAFEHTLLLQAQKQYFREFVLQGRAPQIVLAVSKKAMPNYRSIADLKGKKIGVTAPGSSTSIMASFVLAKAGLSAKDVAFIGVGAGAGAIAALQSGQIDAIANLDPVMTRLERAGDIRVVSDTRTLADTRNVFGGDMPGTTEPARRHRPKRDSFRPPRQTRVRRHRQGSRARHQFHQRRRSNRALPRADAQGARPRCHTPRARRAGGRRTGVRRRGHDRPRDARPSLDVARAVARVTRFTSCTVSRAAQARCVPLARASGQTAPNEAGQIRTHVITHS